MEPEISVVMACYNEGPTVGRVIERVLALPLHLEMIAVDDGSDDDTPTRLAEAAARDSRVIVLTQPMNRGKGAALRRGFRAARGDVVCIQDADWEYDPEDLPGLIAPLRAGCADVVYGSRFLERTATARRPSLHRTVNGALTLLSNVVTGLHLTDMETGHKAFRRSLLDGIDLREERFGIEPELTAKLARQHGTRFVEVPVRYHPRTVAEGKKIGWRDGVRALIVMARYGRFGVR